MSCGCYQCWYDEPKDQDDPFAWLRPHMFLCEHCGNKRCPHATDHRHNCTGSNESGQPGSSYVKV